MQRAGYDSGMYPFDQGAVLLDVRTPEETDAGHVPGAVLIPIDQLASRTGEVRAAAGGLNRPVLIMCKRGRRAEQGVEILRRAGFQRPQNIGGTEVEPLRSLLGGLRRRERPSLRSWAPRH